MFANTASIPYLLYPQNTRFDAFKVTKLNSDAATFFTRKNVLHVENARKVTIYIFWLRTCRAAAHHVARLLAALWTCLPALGWECRAKSSLTWYGLMPCARYLWFGNASETSRSPLHALLGVALKRPRSTATILFYQPVNRATAMSERIADITTIYLIDCEGSCVLHWFVSGSAICCADGL